MTTRTLQQMIAQYPEHRAALKHLLHSELTQELETTEYAGGKHPLPASSDNIMRTIVTLDECLQSAEELQQLIDGYPAGELAWLLGDDTEITNHNLSEIFARLEGSNKTANGDWYEHWQHLISAASTLFDVL